jgi:beta-glucosidase-like glycosyl hydrolase
MTDNKRVTNKQIIEALRELKINRAELDVLATKIVNKMVRLKSMEDWYAHLYNTELAAHEDTIEMSEEEEALGEAARLMTLMNLFQDKEEYEKCAIIKKHMNKINKILRKYK